MFFKGIYIKKNNKTYYYYNYDYYDYDYYDYYYYKYFKKHIIQNIISIFI